MYMDVAKLLVIAVLIALSGTACDRQPASSSSPHAIGTDLPDDGGDLNVYLYWTNSGRIFRGRCPDRHDVIRVHCTQDLQSMNYTGFMTTLDGGLSQTIRDLTEESRRIQTAIKEGQKTVLTEMLGDNLDEMKSGDLRKAIKRGDKFVEKVVEEAAEYTGIAVANLINIFNPDTIVLGGGVIEQMEDQMMAIIVETAHDYALDGTSEGIEIVASKLGDNAGITGGAVLARRELA